MCIYIYAHLHTFTVCAAAQDRTVGRRFVADYQSRQLLLLVPRVGRYAYA